VLLLLLCISLAGQGATEFVCLFVLLLWYRNVSSSSSCYLISHNFARDSGSMCPWLPAARVLIRERYFASESFSAVRESFSSANHNRGAASKVLHQLATNFRARRVFTKGSVKNSVFWVWRRGGVCCLHFQGRKEATVQQEASGMTEFSETWVHFPRSTYKTHKLRGP
jgi:hypothetical protein